ncbi:hypothetical protein [Rhabdaerophilum calidifontis]|uniref:hypothetical protein n=1 Tax=Rhabdaerophilum calidifontis TaxID=2604328 RepID=UPI00123AAA64|nr:hypothetical protein [Rhabdaerophilum calidifontis]
MRLVLGCLALAALTILPATAQDGGPRARHGARDGHHRHGHPVPGPTVIVETGARRDRCAGPSHGGSASAVTVDGETFAVLPRRADHCPAR